MPGLPGQNLGHRHALVLGFVGQHGAAHHVTDGVDVRQIGVVVAVDLDEAALVEVQAHRLGAQPGGVRQPPDADDQLVELGGDTLAALLVADVDLVAIVLDGGDAHAEVKVQPLLLELLEGFLRHGGIGTHQEAGQGFEHGDAGAQPPPDAAQLHADDARADHAECLGHGTELQGAAVFHDVAAKGGQRQRPWTAARRHDDVLGPDFTGLGTCYAHDPLALVLPQQLAQAVIAFDLVLLEQVGHAAGQLVDHAGFAAQHLAQIDCCALDQNAVLGGLVVDHLELLRAVEQRLAGNAADVQAGAAQRGLAVTGKGVDAGHREPQLRGADGRDVAARATADHYNVIRIHNWMESSVWVAGQKGTVSGTGRGRLA